MSIASRVRCGTAPPSSTPPTGRTRARRGSPRRRRRRFLSQVGRDPGQLRIGLVTEAWNGAPVDPECKAAVERAGKLCEARGHRIVPVDLDHDGRALIDACNLILLSGLGGLIAQREAELGRKARRDELEPLTWAAIEAYRGTLAVELHGALARINRFVRAAARAFRAVDVVITPTLASPPVPLGTLRSDVTDDREAANRRRLRLLPVHAAVQCQRAAGDVAAAGEKPRRLADRRAMRRAFRRGRDAVPPRGAARSPPLSACRQWPRGAS